MKNFVIVLFSSFVSLSAFSFDAKLTTSKIDHLLEVNKEWKNWPQSGLKAIASYQTESDRISEHLLLVIDQLEKLPKTLLSHSAIKNRTRLLNELRIYAKRKLFPVNNRHEERTPYFIDDFGPIAPSGILLK